MRQGQQHRRGRSRGSSGGNGSHAHHHRKGQNPLARSFESNGPDVKVRGTAADIAAKYIALARDAHSSGDPVLAENYLQHAEHYNRMIIAYREQQMQQSGDAANGGGHRHRHIQTADLSEAGEESEGETTDPGMAEQPAIPPFARYPGQELQPQPQPQPRHDNGRHDERRDDRRQHGRQQEHRAEHRHERGDTPRFRDRRFERPERPEYRGERSEGTDEPRQSREAVPAEPPQPVADAGEVAPREHTPARRRERFDMMKDQPEFLRRPVRRPRREDATEGEDQGGGSAEEKPGV
jgi:hypothetical protein